LIALWKESASELEAHLAFEENWVFPHLSQEDAASLRAEHDQWRALAAAGIEIEPELINDHAARETRLINAFRR